MRVLVSFCFILLFSSVFAESTLPDGCQPLPVQGDMFTVKLKKKKLLYVHNILGMDLWLTFAGTNAASNEGWSSRLQSENWSALVVDKEAFVLSCIESRPGHEQQVPCQGAIAICQWKGAKIPSDTKQTNYLAGEDMSLAALTADIGGRGYIAPTRK